MESSCFLRVDERIKGFVMKNPLKHNKKAFGIIGCGAQARYILDILRWLKFKGPIYIVDPLGKGPKSVYGLKVFRISKIEEIKKFLKSKKARFLGLAISDNVTKLNFIEAFSEHFDFPALIHPNAVVSPSAEIEDGCLINPFVYIGPGAVVKKGCFLHSFVNIDHDCYIGECANISPGATLAGRVKTGLAIYIYTQATIIPDVKIGDYAVIGAGANVLKDVPSKRMVAGNPAKNI